jgi:hypothetical protein
MSKSNTLEPVFDWYQATIPAHPRAIEVALMDALGVEHTNDTKGLRNYAYGMEFVRGGDVVARMMYGGANGNPNVWASGEDAQAFASVIRDLWPEHRVTRADSAYDFRGPGSWERLYDAAVSIADRKGLTLNTYGDWLRPDAPEGRTLYIGSRKSPVLVRLYEKGKQLRASGVVAPRNSPLDWVRLEIQVRPAKDRKSIAAGMSARDFWGFSAWTAELHAEVANGDVERVSMHDWRAPDDARAWCSLARPRNSERMVVRTGRFSACFSKRR